MFGNFHDVCLEVFKFENLCGDGEYDDDVDVGLEGWNFTVFGPGLPVYGVRITTDASGHACLVVQPVGVYTVVEKSRTAGRRRRRHDAVCMGRIRLCHVPGSLMFGNWKWFDITVFKYEDVNGNGEFDAGDIPLPGWDIYVYGWPWSYDSSVALDEVTDGTGHANFTITVPGFYEIYEEQRAGWCMKEPFYGYYWFDAYSGAVYDEFRFGNFECVDITVFKYEDVDSDGTYDAGSDKPIPGWWIDLYLNGEWYDGGYTNGTGYLVFTVCYAGEYTLVEELYYGYVTPINPASGMYVFDVQSGSVLGTFMFGNFFDVYIPVFKYEDVDGDGVYDQGYDTPLGDWEFSIDGPGVVNPTAVTDSSGYAWFRVNRSGEYIITEEDKLGWIHVNPSDGDLNVTVSSGDRPMPLLFGNFRPVDIWVFKWDDVYADGQYCPGEGDKPIWNWTFYLYMLVGDEWVLIDEELTGPDGRAHFVLTVGRHLHGRGGGQDRLVLDTARRRELHLLRR